MNHWINRNQTASLSLEQRFWEKVDKQGEDQCWLWLASGVTENHKYGLFYLNEQVKSIQAHRVAWMLVNGDIPQGAYICHTCDNPPCCNPKHLFLGDPQLNVDDMVNKGRANWQKPDYKATAHMRARGENSGKSKMSEAQVLAFVEKATSNPTVSLSVYSDEYGVSRGALTDILAGLSWGWLTGIKEHTSPRGKATGERVATAKLSSTQVLEIKEALKNNYRGLSNVLAEKYGVHKTVISRIKTGAIWASIN